MGWGSAGGGHPLENGPQGQARMLTRAFDLLARRSSQWDIRGAIWFTGQDRRDGRVCRFCRHAGLFDAAGRPKPVWDAFKAVTAAPSPSFQGPGR